KPAKGAGNRNELNSSRNRPLGLRSVQRLVDVAGQGFISPCWPLVGPDLRTIMYIGLPVNVNCDSFPHRMPTPIASEIRLLSDQVWAEHRNYPANPARYQRRALNSLLEMSKAIFNPCFSAERSLSRDVAEIA